MRGSTAALVLCGCSFSAQQVDATDAASTVLVDGAQPGDGGGGFDAPTIDGGPGGTGYCGGTFDNVCVAIAPTNSLTLPTQINTDTSSLCTQFTAKPGILACAIVAQSITVSGTVSVTGRIPLILLADTITVSAGGTLDLASRRGAADGAGGNASACGTNGMAAGVGGNGEGGGGAGGSFGARGGDGGDGATGGQRGRPADQSSSAFLRGGCTGAPGGGAMGGAGGHGGGAVLLIGRSTIQVDGAINVSGAAGSGGKVSGGGGGGGSGGMIVLDTANLTVNGQCFANGGGAGQGAVATPGDDGRESPAPATGGVGGTAGNVNGGAGGAGGFGPSGAGGQGAKGQSNMGFGGGGGGGGSVGVIHVVAAISTGIQDAQKVSPNPN